jgi:6-phosphofructokinase 1
MKLKNIAVLTSGGDAPGMNAAIRAVVRAASYYNLGIYGVYGGYDGLINNKIELFNVRSVSNILGSGGTMLKSSRCPEFRTKAGRKKAFNNLKKHDIHALIVIGGDGTITGAKALGDEHNMPVVGIPATIDNDLAYTDYTIGFDTATNVATQCIDKIRDTADSHDRLFFVEVMGRDSGFIALRSAIASGAICAMLPENNISTAELVSTLRKGYQNEKKSSIVIVAEGNKNGGAVEIARQVEEEYNDYETKVTVLGHLQRGGDPTCFDRLLAGELGVGAVEALLSGHSGVMIGIIGSQTQLTPIADCIKEKPKLNPNHLKLANILSI